MTVNLSPTDSGRAWLEANRALLKEPVGRFDTKRFGGPRSDELKRTGKELAAWLGAVSVQEEAPDGFGGEWDLLCTKADGSRFVIECVTGEQELRGCTRQESTRGGAADLVPVLG